MAKTATLQQSRRGKAKRSTSKDVLENMLVRIALERTNKNIGRILRSGPLDMADWAAVMHVKPRTLSERLRQRRDFPPLEQDRVLLVEQVMERGREVFGNPAVFKRWLDSPRPVLGNRKPKELLVTSEGIGAVMAELGRIEHGVY